MLDLFRTLGTAIAKRGCFRVGAAQCKDADSAYGERSKYVLHDASRSRYWVKRTIHAAGVKAMDSRVVEKGVVKGADVDVKDSAALQLRRCAHILWEDDTPKTALIVKAPKNAEATQALREIGLWLMSKGIVVYVEKAVRTADMPEFVEFEPQGSEVDFCVTLGGDGTVLHLASLFEEDEPLPPVISFAMGGVGFLTPFDVKDFTTHLTRLLIANQQVVGCTLRTRKRCEVYTAGGRCLSVHHALNECIIDRGASATTITLDLFVDGAYVTTVTANGLIIATPTGSTAYCMTAGGPMVAPSVPCTVIMPVAPFSLSFRPLVIPETSDIIFHVAKASKSMARASFDGRHQTRLVRGSSVRMTTSLCPLPLINVGEFEADWYEGITQKLKWNQSLVQLPKRPPGIPDGVGMLPEKGSNIKGTGFGGGKQKL